MTVKPAFMFKNLPFILDFNTNARKYYKMPKYHLLLEN